MEARFLRPAAPARNSQHRPIAGALDEDEYVGKLQAAGFTDVTVEPTRIYRVEDARGFLASAGIDVDALGPKVDGKFRSAFVRAVKPAKV